MAFAAAMTAASAAMSAAGAFAESRQVAAQQSYQAKVAQMNAQIARDNASRAGFRGQVLAEDVGRQGARERGEQVAAMTGSGFALSSGSYMTTRRGLEEQVMLDQMRTVHGGQAEASRFNQEANNYETDAAAARKQAKATKQAGLFAVASSLISAAASAPSGSFGGSSSLMKSAPFPRPRPGSW